MYTHIPRVACCAPTFLFAFLYAQAAQSSVLHGNFFDPEDGSVMYRRVIESSGTDPVPPARFGAPTIDGNELDYDPKEFTATSLGGTPDLTDVQLNFGLMATRGAVIQAIEFSERGDFILWPPGGPGVNSVVATLSVLIEVIEIDGQELPESLFISRSDDFSATSPNAVLGRQWANEVYVNLTDALVRRDIPFNRGVTKAKVVVDDTLIAQSSPPSGGIRPRPGGVSHIAKKDFKIRVWNEGRPPETPEPTGIVLALLAAGAFGYRTRWRS